MPRPKVGAAPDGRGVIPFPKELRNDRTPRAPAGHDGVIDAGRGRHWRRPTRVPTPPSRPSTDATDTEGSRHRRHRRGGRGASTAPARCWARTAPAVRAGKCRPTTAPIPTPPTHRSRGPILLGSSLPLSGGPAASAYAPFADGMNAYVAYANENELVPGHEIQLQIGDDQFNPALTPNVVNGLLDSGVVAMTGIIGSGPNLAVADLLNEECVPQMFGQSGPPRVGRRHRRSPVELRQPDPLRHRESCAYATQAVELYRRRRDRDDVLRQHRVR